MEQLQFFGDVLERILYFFVDIFNWFKGFHFEIGDFVLNGFSFFGIIFFTSLIGIWVVKILF